MATLSNSEMELVSVSWKKPIWKFFLNIINHDGLKYPTKISIPKTAVINWSSVNQHLPASSTCNYGTCVYIC